MFTTTITRRTPLHNKNAENTGKEIDPSIEPLALESTQQETDGSRLVLFTNNEVGDKYFSIELDGDEETAICVQKSDPEALILSGGGAKGVVYPGVVKALEDSNTMEKIHRIVGTSAGAITGAVIASGMTGDECKNLMNTLDFAKLLKKDALPDSELFSSSTTSKAKALFSIATNLNTTAPNLTNSINKKSRESALKRIEEAEKDGKIKDEKVCRIRDKLSNQESLELLLDEKKQGKTISPTDSERLKKLEEFVQKKKTAQDELATLKKLENRYLLGELSALTHEEALQLLQSNKAQLNKDISQIGNLTFDDLYTLHQHIPGIKEFECTGTALHSGAGVAGKSPQLVVFNRETTPDMEIANAVLISSALPVIFKEIEQPMPYDVTDGSVKTCYIDGGFPLNPPAPSLLAADTHYNNNLIIALENAALTDVLEGKSVTNSLKKKFLGLFTPKNKKYYDSGKQYVAKQLATPELKGQTVVARLKGVPSVHDYSDGKGTLAFQMTQEEKSLLQKDLYSQTTTHLQNRQSETKYKSLDHLLYGLSDDQFDKLNKVEEKNPVLAASLARTADLRSCRKLASGSLETFSQTMKKWEDAKPNMMKDIMAWIAQLDEGIGFNKVPQDAIAEMIVHSTDPSMQRMLDILRNNQAGIREPSELLLKCLQQDEAKSCKNIANKIIRDFIYPTLERPTQISSANKQLLNQAEKDLKTATTRSRINEILGDIESRYQVFGSSRFNTFSPVIETLKQYKLTLPAIPNKTELIRV